MGERSRGIESPILLLKDDPAHHWATVYFPFSITTCITRIIKYPFRALILFHYAIIFGIHCSLPTATVTAEGCIILHFLCAIRHDFRCLVAYWLEGWHGRSVRQVDLPLWSKWKYLNYFFWVAITSGTCIHPPLMIQCNYLWWSPDLSSGAIIRSWMLVVCSHVTFRHCEHADLRI